MLAPAPPRPPSLLKRVLGAFSTPTPPAARPYIEMGVSGTAVYSGFIQLKERSSQWIGAQRYITISDMAVNASIVAAGVHYFLNLIAHPKWTLEPADESAEAKAAAELVDECLQDLSQPWSRVVRRAGAYRFYGFSVQEWTAKKRRDGKIGLESIEMRPQSTIEQWSVDESGAVIGVWQRGPQTGKLLGIPRKKLLYLVDDVLSDSPEGVGIFRHLAEPWERLKQYYVLEARAFERDLRGTPVGRVPYTLIREAVANGDITKADADKTVAAMESFVKLQVKESDTAITLDSIPYYSQAADGSKVAALPQWGLELLQGGSAGMAEVAAAITRTETEMARIIACEGLMMGEQSGNRSLGEDKSRNLYLIGNAVLSDVIAGVEQDIIPVICDLNGIAEELRPVPKAEDIAFKDAEAVAAVLQKMAQAGAVLSPDDPVIEDVRSLMGVSPPPPPSPEMMGLTSPEPGGPEDDGEGGPGPSGDDEEELSGDEDEDVQKKYDPNHGPEDDGKGGPGPSGSLYVSRRLLNAGAVRAWAKEQGFKSALPAGDMHVTVAYSKEPVDWSAIEPEQDALVAQNGARSVEQFGDGVTVLTLESADLQRRWQELRDAGASWDHSDYRPHVTITYDRGDVDISAIEPYRGPLIFGPEEPAEIDEDGFDPDSIEEQVLKALYSKDFDPNQPRDDDGKWTDEGGSGGSGIYMRREVSGTLLIGGKKVPEETISFHDGEKKIGTVRNISGNSQTGLEQGSRVASGRGETIRWRAQLSDQPGKSPQRPVYFSSKKKAISYIEENYVRKAT